MFWERFYYCWKPYSNSDDARGFVYTFHWLLNLKKSNFFPFLPQQQRLTSGVAWSATGARVVKKRRYFSEKTSKHTHTNAELREHTAPYSACDVTRTHPKSSSCTRLDAFRGNGELTAVIRKSLLAAPVCERMYAWSMRAMLVAEMWKASALNMAVTFSDCSPSTSTVFVNEKEGWLR